MSSIENKQGYKRRFTRVGLSRTVSLYVNDQFYDLVAIRNLSIGGLFVEGKYDCKIGEKCEVELQETGENCSLLLKLTAVVRRIEEYGLALEFEKMSDTNLMFLQTVVLYSSSDPCSAAEEFLVEYFKKTNQEC